MACPHSPSLRHRGVRIESRPPHQVAAHSPKLISPMHLAQLARLAQLAQQGLVMVFGLTPVQRV